MSDSKTVIAITLKSGLELIGVEVVKTIGGVVMKNPQTFVILQNKFIPWGMLLDNPEREFTFKFDDILFDSKAHPAFDNAFRETFPEMFQVSEELQKEMDAIKAENFANLELNSPVHGKTKSETGIILK